MRRDGESCVRGEEVRGGRGEEGGGTWRGNAAGRRREIYRGGEGAEGRSGRE